MLTREGSTDWICADADGVPLSNHTRIDKAYEACTNRTLADGLVYRVVAGSTYAIQSDGVVIPPVDTDGDGVNDDVDQCPGTTQGVEVDAVGCEIIPPDADGDGIPDAEDTCPNDATNTCNNPPGEVPAAIAACIASPDAWCSLSDHTPNEVLPTRAEVGDLIWSGSGSSSVLNAWNGMAVDEDRNILYFTGNGHTDYLGTEVLAYYLDTGTFERIIEPAPADFYYENLGQFAAIPDIRKYCATHHNYDGLLFVPVTGTILCVNNGMGADNMGIHSSTEPVGLTKLELSDIGGVYEINPSATEARNGLSPLDSRKVSTRRFLYGRSAIGENGQIYLGTHTQIYKAYLSSTGLIIDDNPTYQNLPRGQGNLIYADGKLRGFVQYTTGEYMIWDEHGAPEEKYNFLSTEGSSIAGGQYVLAWRGKNNLSLITPQGEQVITHATGPGSNVYYVFSKWAYLDKLSTLTGKELYIGAPCATCKVWLYKFDPSLITSAAETSENIAMIDVEGSGSFR